MKVLRWGRLYHTVWLVFVIVIEVLIKKKYITLALAKPEKCDKAKLKINFDYSNGGNVIKWYNFLKYFLLLLQ